MNKTFRKLILPASILASLQVNALGLGNLQVNSALDEVLDGKIPLVADSTEDLSGIKVGLATSEDYERVDLDKSYVPANIKIEVLEEDGNKFISLSSEGPVSEPIISLLLSVDWANGHLLREYTVLLDPPLFNNTQIEQNYSQPVQTNTYQQNQSFDEGESPTSTSSTQTTISPTPQTSSSNSESSYNSSSMGSKKVTVEAGDTLWRIANQHNSGYGSPQQMMVAIFNNNPAAFNNNDMNQLRKGAVLDIPDADEVTMISKSEALSQVKSQTASFSRLQTENDYQTGDSGSDKDYGIELVPPRQSESGNSGNTSGSNALQKQYEKSLSDLALAREELASATQENLELSDRVKELEKIVKDQELALSLKDDDLALLQKQVEDATNTSDDVWGDSQADNTLTDAENSEIDAEIEQSEDDATTDAEGYTLTDETTSDELSDDSTSESDTENTDIASNDTNDDSLQISDVNDESVDTQPSTNNAQNVQSQPVRQEKSFLDKIMDYKYEGLIGLGAILLAIFGFLFFKGRNKDDEDSGDFLDTIGRKEVEEDLSAEEAQILNDEFDDFDNFDSVDEEKADEFSELENDSEVSVMDDESEEATDLDLSGLDDLDLDADEKVSDDVDMSEEDLDFDSFDVHEDSDESDEIENEEDETSEEFDFESESEDLESDEQEELNFDDFSLDDDSDDSDDLNSESETDSEDDLSLDFDLDSLDFDNEESTETTDAVDDDTEETSEEEIVSENYDLEFNLDSDEETLEEVAESQEELEDLTFDTGERTIVEEESDDEFGDLDLGDFEFDLGDTDESSSENLEDNLSDVKLDLLDEEDVESSENEELTLDTEDSEASEDTNNEDGEFDLGLDFDGIGGDDAIDTKLDLAKAYFEMGDIEGAKQMLVEILDEGNEEQVAKAQELSKKLDS
ncbi:MAG: FimV/HubP family polar landmark protein [Gammaproteobacteria bacterium]